MDVNDILLDRPRVLFSDFFGVSPETLEAYGTVKYSGLKAGAFY